MRNLIPPFVRPMMRLVGADDRGAVGALVGMLLATGVLLGMAALTVDVGMIYQERAELQNGADAGSIAVAKSCAAPVPPAVTGTCTPGTAANYANLNSKDGVSTVTLVCGHDPGGVLPSCPAPTGPAIVNCPTAPSAGTNYVDVHTATQTTGGSSLLPPVFSRALAGNAGYQGSTVLACARAMWGPAVKSANSLAMTLSLCAWTQATGGTPPTFDGVDRLIFVRDAPNAPTCLGLSQPGEFGWLDDVGDCTAAIDLTQDGNAAGESDPGKNVSDACQEALKSYLANQTPIYIPIFDTTTGTGNSASYHLVGLAAFILTGWANMPGMKNEIPSAFPNDACKGSTNPSCIFGHFTQALLPVSTTTDGAIDFGAIAIKLAG